MKEKRPSPVKRLLQWAGPERKWLILSVLCAFGSGILVITSYIGIYRLMDAVLSICLLYTSPSPRDVP